LTGTIAEGAWSEGEELEAAALVGMALEEDVGVGDWTSLWTVNEEARASAAIVAREPIVVAGCEVARLVFSAVDPRLEVRVVVSDGGRVGAGGVLLRVEGPARGILTAERTALNFLGHLSGIATLTRSFVDEIRGTRARITETRKTTPGWRYLEKWAVRLGGGSNHRMGLHDMVLVKDNHVALAGGVAEAARRVLSRNTEGLPVVIEVDGPAELAELRGLPLARILLDNMEVDEIAESVRTVAGWPEPRPELEASGNMTIERVRGVAETGVSWISVGALTHSAPSADLSLEMDSASG
jgi:nicotinate-nucleotide pyrophosphorylase (carboxylating)